METTKAKSAFAIVVDVKTGEIFGFFDSTHSKYQRQLRISKWNANPPWIGRLLRSWFCIETTGCCISLKRRSLHPRDTLIDCHGGYWRIHGASIRDDHPKNILTVTEVIQHSSNIGAAKVALELGKEGTINYLRKFGLGQDTGLGFPLEPRGILKVMLLASNQSN